MAIEWHDFNRLATMLRCPITENGVVRIISHPRYPNGPILPSEVLAALSALYTLGTWEFAADDVSLSDEDVFRMSSLNHSDTVTDTYLLGLCQKHDARFVTMDRKLTTLSLARPDVDLIVRI